MNIAVDLSSILSADYEKLYESGRYTDISIHVGKEPNNKIFLAHTLVLWTRSTLLENSLTGDMEATELVQRTAITFEDVTPDVFELLLRYIYTGRISYDLGKNIDWISLLDGASKFRLLDLLTGIENYLIDKQKEWIQQNIITVHKYAASMASLNKLLDHCNQIMVSHPGIIFKSNDIATLPKESLITLLKNDELEIDEDDIFISVIQWATKQVPELELSDIDNWSFNDLNTVKETIADCIPLIRFSSISSKNIVLYDNLLPKRLRDDVLMCRLERDYTPITHMLPPRTGQGPDIDSVVINKEQAKWISSKVVESTRLSQENQRTSITMKDDVYKFTLLYRRSRDGNTVAKFRELCNNKGPTIAVGKVLDTEEVFGGYNPFAWGAHKDWFQTEESFIFALGKSRDENIVSFFADKDKYTIYDYHNCFPCFGGGYDLCFGYTSNMKGWARQRSYQVSLRHSRDEFDWDDWEVFLVSKL